MYGLTKKLAHSREENETYKKVPNHDFLIEQIQIQMVVLPVNYNEKDNQKIFKAQILNKQDVRGYKITNYPK